MQSDTALLAPLQTSHDRSIFPKRILLATDIEDLDHTLPVALEEALRYDAQLVILHVLPDFVSPSMAPSLLVYSRPEQHVEFAEAKLSAAVALARSQHIRCVWKMVRGSIVDQVGTFARDWQADRLVVGCHGVTKFYLQILGSNAEKLFRHLPISVLAVGPEARPQLSPRGTPLRVLIPVSLKHNGDLLFQYAARLAALESTIVTLLHVTDQAGDNHIKSRASMLRSLAHAAGVSRMPACLVRAGAVSRSILKEASDGEFDLIVLGNISDTTFYPTIVPSSAYEILCSASCPILILKDAVESIATNPAASRALEQ